LNLLKSQVQPHFLFNTLNNIYYEAYREAPATAALIEKLSDIMRYFVEESQKECVSLGKELHFIENYIGLETIRLRHGIQLTFTKNVQEQLQLPPMLLMTFVENIFKHGIDRMRADNKVAISLEEKDGYLLFTTINRCYKQALTKGGFGIDNLRKRLFLLYANDFVLETNCTDTIYKAFLKIPVA
jgi:LytS/YehU family sensor histidine kinase